MVKRKSVGGHGSVLADHGRFLPHTIKQPLQNQKREEAIFSNATAGQGDDGFLSDISAICFYGLTATIPQAVLHCRYFCYMPSTSL